MKKTSAITLTLLSAAALAACGGQRREPVLAGYRDPYDTTRTSSTPRAGYVPFYRYGYRGGSRGSYGSRGGRVGGVSRGGFGGTGGGHGAGS